MPEIETHVFIPRQGRIEWEALVEKIHCRLEQLACCAVQQDQKVSQLVHWLSVLVHPRTLMSTDTSKLHALTHVGDHTEEVHEEAGIVLSCLVVKNPHFSRRVAVMVADLYLNNLLNLLTRSDRSDDAGHRNAARVLERAIDYADKRTNFVFID